MLYASPVFTKSAMAQLSVDRPTGRAAVLELIQRNGPISVDSLAEMLGLTAMAVRQHVYALEYEDLVEGEEEARPRGRPLTLWRTTAKAAAEFADSHSALAVDLIAQMKKAFGEEGMDRILKLRTAEQEKAYGARVDGYMLKTRLEQLAKLRSAEGYMAEVRYDADAHAWLFVENHCPICAAARLCSGLCREELALFKRVLGPGVKVERVSHILAGAGRCAYRVRPG